MIGDIFQKGREQKYSKQHWGGLRDLAELLREATDLERKEIASEIHEFAKRAVPDKQHHYNPNDLKYGINNILGKFTAILVLQTRNFENFIVLAELLDSLFRLWQSRLVMKPAKDLVKDLQTVKYVADQNELRSYNTYGFRYVELMNSYNQFASTVNENYGHQVMRYIESEPVPDLWRG
ncbi:hypothetical protein ACFLWB_02005 [Chloroflexota bacterium]